MRATTAYGAASAAATSVLRSLETTTTTTTTAAAAVAGGVHLEPAFRVLPPVSSLLSCMSYSNRAISTSFASSSASIAREDLLRTSNTNKKITTLPQLSSAMQLAYSSRHYDQVLSLYSQGDDPIIKPASKSDPRSAAMTYDCALKACAAAAEARQAQRILSTMWKRGVPVGRVAQGSVIKALCAAGQRQTAFQHIKGIPAARVTTMHCNTLLSACAAAHDTTLGLKVWEFMKKRGVDMDNVSYCEALRVFGTAGDVERLVSLWKDQVLPALSSLKDDKNLGNSTRVVNSKPLIASKEESLDEEVLIQRKNESKTMVAAAYAGALAAAGDVPLAMAQCASIMDMLCHLLPQELHLAIELETERTDDHQMANNNNNNKKKMKSNTASGGRQTAAPLDNLRSACNAVLHAAVSSHQWKYLREMVALMTSRGLPPDVITYNALLKAAVKRGEGPRPIHVG
jgi:pentatricopeptide repeat protein